MLNNILRCLASRATIGDRHRDRDKATMIGNNSRGIGGNSAGIGDNSAEISDDAAGIVDITANVIPC